MSDSQQFEPNIDIERKILDYSSSKDLRSCYQCGSCAGICPWRKIDTRKFNPRTLIREAQLGEEAMFAQEELWLCLMCKECTASCPQDVGIPQVMKGIRSLSCERGEVPREFSNALNNLFELGNPWGRGIRERTEWSDDLGVKEYENQDILLWVGCLGAYDKRNQRVTRSLARLLDMVEVSWGILGADEKCCGDSALQLGELIVFEELVEHNTKVIQDSGAEKIVTISPHCYNTLKNEYCDLDVEVLHYSQYLNELSRNLDFGSFNFTVTYQDPCYLGRYNDIYGEPRKVLRSIPGLEFVEMENSRERSVCCGGGGGRFWADIDPDERLSNVRLEEVLTIEAEVLATACPFCLVNFEDSAKFLNVEEKIEVLDISEIAFEAVER